MALGANRGHVVRLVLARRIRANSLWTIHWVTVDVCCGAIPGSQLYGMNPYNPGVDAGGRCDAGIIRVGRVGDSSAPGKLDFAGGGVAGGVTPLNSRTHMGQHDKGTAMKYPVSLMQTEEGYSVSCPGLPGCWSQGATEEEALSNIRDAIREYVEVARQLAVSRI